VSKKSKGWGVITVQGVTAKKKASGPKIFCRNCYLGGRQERNDAQNPSPETAEK